MLPMHPYKLIEQGIKHPTILTNNNLPRASPRSQMLWFFSVNYIINSGVQPTPVSNRGLFHNFLLTILKFDGNFILLKSHPQPSDPSQYIHLANPMILI